jgi:hypothetical protein
MHLKSIGVALCAAVCIAVVAVASGSAAAGPRVAAGPAGGFIPSRSANHAGAGGSRIYQLLWHNGVVKHSTTVVPVFWGSRWTSSSFVGDKVSGLDNLYKSIGNTAYLRTNGEYSDASGSVGLGVGKNADLSDSSTTPSGAPSTTAVLNEVSKVTGGHPVAGAYYPVYSDQPRGTARYCAWHSSGTIGGVEVQFGFFFNLDGDPGCDPGSPSSLGHSQGLSALANVTGHELSEMLTDPRLDAWYDQKGAENADKCAWTFNGTVSIGGQSWKIQGNWSNAAASARTGYANVGCIQTR